MKFLFYAPQMASFGGIERHVCLLAAAVARRGHEVTIITTSNSLGADLRDELASPRITLRELPLARRSAGKLVKLRWLVSEIARARKQSWDVIYTNGQSALAAVVWQARQPHTRIVHNHHTSADPGEQSSWSAAFRHVLREADELVGCCKYTRESLNRAIGRRDVRYLPCLTRPLPSQAAPLPASRAAKPILHFGYLGRLIPEKGIDVICALSREPALADIHWHLHGTGEAYPPEFFRDFPGVTYHGLYTGAEEHERALTSLDAVVLLSQHSEGLPLTLTEGMAFGLPWVATDRGGTPELAVNPDDTVIVPASATLAEVRDAVRSLADAIRDGRTSRIRQRAAYDQVSGPVVATSAWLEYFEAGQSAGQPL